MDGAQTERQGTQGLDGGAFFLFSHCLFSFLGLGKVLSVGKSPKQRGNAVLLRPKSSSWVWSEGKNQVRCFGEHGFPAPLLFLIKSI